MDAHAVLDAWHGRSGEYSPAYYAYYGPNDTSETVRAAIESRLGTGASVLELGCSAGRHLSHLHAAGFGALSGIEINERACDVLADAYPALAAAGTFYFDAIEAVITDFEDDRFDAVYSVEALQHLHPDHDWVFEEVARVTADVLVTVENETSDAPDRTAASPVTMVDDAFPIYHRDWAAVFTGLGFTQVESMALDRDTVRVFRNDPN